MQLPEVDRLEYAIRLQFQTINNEAKYEALTTGLDFTKALGTKAIVVRGDLQLIIGQVNGTYDVKGK